MTRKYKAYNLSQMDSIPQLAAVDPIFIEEMKIVGDIFPFKTNDYVLENLIDWGNYRQDPIFRLNFPRKEMLTDEKYEKLKWAKSKSSEVDYMNLVREIRNGLNPHPAGQSTFNVPFMGESKLEGMQHKYKPTILFFPSHGQTCHAHCTFCFRWPQFISDPAVKFQAKGIKPLIEYLRLHAEITDVLITGGDPMIMNSRILLSYIEPLLEIKSVKTIRIGTKVLSFWPSKFTSDEDAAAMLDLFRRIVAARKHLAIMAHFNHPAEMGPDMVAEAIYKIKTTGAQIRTQAPLLRHINNSADVWATMWQKQVELGCVPYYMFLARDTGAQHYFSVSLQDALGIYRGAITQIGGLGRTVRGPVMSVLNGKVELLDFSDGVYIMRYIQHRSEELSYKLFKGISKDGLEPCWFDDLTETSNIDSVYFNKSLDSFGFNDLYESDMSRPILAHGKH